MSAGRGLYAILGLKPGATPDEIKKAYRTLARKYHPDKVGSDSEKMVDINKANLILSNERMRYLYDNYRFTDGVVHHRSEGSSSRRPDFHFEGEGDNIGDIAKAIAKLAGQMILTPLQNITLLCQSEMYTTLSSLQAMRHIFWNRGLSGFFHGSLAQSVLDYLGQKFSGVMEGAVLKNKTHPMVHQLVNMFFTYPFDLIAAIYRMRMGESVLDIIGCLYQANGIMGFWDGFLLSTAVSVTLGCVDMGLEMAAHYATEKHLDNPKSKIWRWSYIAMTNPVVNALIYSGITLPMYGLTLKRQMQAIRPPRGRHSLLDIITGTWKYGGLSRIYAGFVPYALYIEIDSRQINLETIHSSNAVDDDVWSMSRTSFKVKWNGATRYSFHLISSPLIR
ncbi:hypothetical protein SAMD00019534_056960 [Acytostelium subglobosum LB1]|uniref:hypothetical protein n=1 Tax=Acytostelium subglobosum LB1 TaxID=1410327 RepID=UPI0006451B8D|nr:hypothetical protein SAMD00019534_056960 [Acytostelium subglobosum LB1]GAM22521.1 hypothetical protein SAMD00019534_056960 [Acytostelium subglobosum LB1]|eukprot:XP_012754641.1 hypothetical protein SAMD00019534_056960 [Acytostelium subglobosum LB1]